MEFMLGCNYWASNAGTEMWRDFDTDAIESDFKRYAEYGLKYLRVFPNWRDFQPIHPFYTASNTLREFRNEKGELFDNPYYLDMQMIERFRTFCRINSGSMFSKPSGTIKSSSGLSGLTITAGLSRLFSRTN